jgi:exopolysaccharide biosynthesis protein
VKKAFQLLLLLSLISIQLFAQTDSLVVVNARWQQKKLAKRVVWKSVLINDNKLFGANQNISIIEIAAKAKHIKLAVAYSDSLEGTSVIGMRSKALAAINGSFFKMRGIDPDHPTDTNGRRRLQRSYIGKNRSVVYLRVKDSLISPQIFEKDSVRLRHQQGVVAISKKQVSILSADTARPDWEAKLTASDVISTGPVMLLTGQYMPIPNDAFCNDRHPRTAVGKKADGSLILLVVDGRMAQAAGMSIPELQKTMRWLGCTDAINLDGGGSTTMYIKGEPDNGVVNHPSDNKQFDHLGEREVANAILVLAD